MIAPLGAAVGPPFKRLVLLHIVACGAEGVAARVMSNVPMPTTAVKAA